MEKNGFLSEKSLQTVKSLKKTFLWVAVWILIGELVAGAMIILTQAWTDLVGKVQLSFLVVAVMLFIGVNNFVRIEKGDKTIQGFALVGLICNILWAVICLMLMWEILPSAVEYVSNTNSYNCTHGGSLNCVSYGPSIFLKTLLVALSATTGCFWISNVLAIKETIKTVKPLKITAVVCMAYCSIFAIITTMAYPISEDVSRLAQLSGLAVFAFIITALAAFIVSGTNRPKEHAATITPANEAQLRAEIEEKVRREMIEKDVREKMGVEQPVVNNGESVAVNNDANNVQNNTTNNTLSNAPNNDAVNDLVNDAMGGSSNNGANM